MRRMVCAAALFACAMGAQTRPPLVGLAHITVRVSDLNAARQFYGDLLGYQEAFTIRKNLTASLGGGLPQDQVSAVFFKVNNRQYIEVRPESTAGEPRYVGSAIETNDAEAMRLFLQSLGYAVPDKVDKTPAGDLSFQLRDPDGHLYEILQYTPESLSVKTVGKFLSDERVSARILHVGISISKQETVDFYLKGFSLREFWRADPTMSAPGAMRNANAMPPARPILASLSNLKLPESDDYIEWSLIHAHPAGEAAPENTKRSGRGGGGGLVGGHIALLVPDMARAVAFLRAKPAWKDYTRAAQQESHVGVNHKWQGNFFDPDGTRVECMEADTADGLPSPISKASYYGK
jgi:catechol 2,3-dioxygenase-like lactoylglutathione lyase family enzyme